MCGRFTQQMTWRELHELYGLLASPPDKMRPRWNGAPTQDFAACRADAAGSRNLSRLRWGLIPFWAKDAKIGSKLINARAETVDAKPSFRAAFKSRRCLIPADGWFEWVREGGGKSPRFLSMADESIASFAALWERWEGGEGIVESFTIITTEASPELAQVHARQPAIVDPRHSNRAISPTWPPRPRNHLRGRLSCFARVGGAVDGPNSAPRRTPENPCPVSASATPTGYNERTAGQAV